MFFPFQVSTQKPLIPSPLLLHLWGCSLTQLPTPVFLPWHSPILGHPTPSGSRTSPPTDVQQGPPLVNMFPEPWVSPCLHFGGWYSPQKLQEVWLVDTVALSMGLQTPSASSVPSPTPPLGKPTLSPMVRCEHPSLYLSGSGQASQETAISGFHEQALPGIHSNILVLRLYMG